MTALIIIGIDPGLAHTGLAAIKQENALDRYSPCALLSTAHVVSDSTRTMPSRIDHVVRTIRDFTGIIIAENPEDDLHFAMEAWLHYGTHKHGHSDNVTRVLGAIRGLAVALEIPVSEYSASAVKVAMTGNRVGVKGDIQYEMQRRFLLPKVLRPNHIADASAIAFTHARVRSDPHEIYCSGKVRLP